MIRLIESPEPTPMPPASTATESLTRARFLDRLNVERFCPINPAIAVQAMMLAEDIHSNFASVARVIEADGSLAGRVLGAANAVGARAAPFQNLNRAVAALGLRCVRTLLVSCAILSHLNREGLSGLNWRRYWQFQLSCAIAARRTGRTPDDAGQRFAAALLQNLGILALARIADDRYVGLVNRDPGGIGPLPAAEMDLFGITHAQAGAWLLETWGITDPLISDVRDHAARPMTDTAPASADPPPAGRIAEWIAAVATGIDAARPTRLLARWLPGQAGMRFADLDGLIRAIHADVGDLSRALRLDVAPFHESTDLFEQAAQHLAASSIDLLHQVRLERPHRPPTGRSSPNPTGPQPRNDSGNTAAHGMTTTAQFMEWIARQCQTSAPGDSRQPTVPPPQPVEVLLIRLNGYDQIVDRMGLARGEDLLRRTVHHIREVFGQSTQVTHYRTGMIALLAPVDDQADANERADQMFRQLDQAALTDGDGGGVDVQISIGGVVIDDWVGLDPETVMGLCEDVLAKVPRDSDPLVQVQPLAVAALCVLIGR